MRVVFQLWVVSVDTVCMGGLRKVRSFAVPVLVGLVALFAASAVVVFVDHADSSRNAQIETKSMQFSLAALENDPFSASPRSGGSPSRARAAINTDEGTLVATVMSLIDAGSPPVSLRDVPVSLRRLAPTVQQIYEIGVTSDYRGKRLDPVQALLGRQVGSTMALLTRADHAYSARASSSKRLALIGSLAAILGLLVIFGFFYRRATLARSVAERLAAENERLLERSRDEAITDPLTGLGNRRAFKRDLEAVLPTVNPDRELLVAMFDLDGFKQYNDTFGHAAGDALLSRLATCLKETTSQAGTAYRMGGDEFCLIAQTDFEQGQVLLEAAVSALSDSGEGWEVGCSWGVTWMPSEADGPSQALRIADERMYAQKASRASASHQTTAALVQVLAERDIDLGAHTSHVARLSTATARQLGLPEHEVMQISQAAQLHDIGKTAIPDSILTKTGRLNEDEWTFIRRHTLIGERIVSAAPSLAHTATLVRSTHERVDGRGYPDGLTAAEIPLGSKIIAVCDAYDAMTADRAYRPAMSHTDAVAELRSCAGTQFDPSIVEALCASLPKAPAAAKPSSSLPMAADIIS
jgi:diguanylate cyclase (GGDEF)-like protein